MKVFTIPEPVFKTEPLFILGCSQEILAAYLDKHFHVQIDVSGSPCSGQMFTFGSSPWRVIWAERGTRNNLPIILHEIFHLVTRICADKGVPIVSHHPTGESGDETAAYLFEFFTRALLQKIK